MRTIPTIKKTANIQLLAQHASTQRSTLGCIAKTTFRRSRSTSWTLPTNVAWRRPPSSYTSSSAMTSSGTSPSSSTPTSRTSPSPFRPPSSPRPLDCTRSRTGHGRSRPVSPGRAPGCARGWSGCARVLRRSRALG